MLRMLADGIGAQRGDGGGCVDGAARA